MCRAIGAKAAVAPLEDGVVATIGDLLAVGTSERPVVAERVPPTAPGDGRDGAPRR